MAAALLVGAVAAQTPADGADQKRRLIEQKIRLLEMLINSPAAKGAPYGREAESATLLEKGRTSIDDARKALADGRFDEAAKLLDEALKSASSASRRMSAGEGGLSESAQRKSLQDLGEQVEMYRTSLGELATDPEKGAAARALLGRIDALRAESVQLATGGRLGDANRKLADAYKLAVEEMSRLRAGQEVVLSLKFDTPADEYAYEKKRFASNEIMVDMMIAEGRAEGDKRRLVDGFVDNGRRLGSQADTQASSGQYPEAVKLMEQASAQLIRALQAMGVPVF
ncbi:hypothetical protein [Aromatoleum diolicum]|uniref:hypothetical protein n=1 Tax=Aromatoleum diolicum TaxID=75796 RepID=UPI001FE46798|nr:hypothetical protein [Aromatoleum diolicum]